MPVTLMGFSLQGFSPSQSLRILSDAAAFLTLAQLEVTIRSELQTDTAERVAPSPRLCSL